MTSPIEPRTASLYHASRGSVVEARVAASVMAIAMASYLAIPLLVPADLVMLSAQAAIALVAIVAAIIAGRPLDVIGLRRARGRLFIAALAIGATTWYLNLWLVSFLPLPPRQTQMLAELVERPTLIVALATFAVAPALCEELLFRGLLARSLGRAMPTVVAVLISALVFSAYHLSLVQLLPTFTLGCLLALMAIRADSALPGMLAHATNNALAIVMSRDEAAEIAAWIGSHPFVSLAISATSTWLGIALLLREKR